MARARNIKPSLFKNELLGVADPILTILFTGLWCLADREGRLEDRPLRIKAEIFPYREIDVASFNGYLTELERLGFIWRYKVDDLAIIQVIAFSKHQSPHNTEKESMLPCKPKTYNGLEELTVNAPLNNGGVTAQERSDSLIPDSLNLIADVPRDEIERLPKNPSSPKRNNNSAADTDWLESLKKEEIYSHIDFPTEMRKAQLWLENNAPTRKFTKRYFTGWINRIEKPLSGIREPIRSYNYVRNQPTQREAIEAEQRMIAEMREQ